jgi:hypothetical protein
MNRTVCIASTLLVLFFIQPERARAASPRLLIAHVNIVDVRTGELFTDRNVIIADQRIQSIEPARGVVKKQPGDVVVNGRGKYLIPGLWDCHVHLSFASASALPLFISLGITSVRDTGGRLSEIDDWRSRITTGSLVGPRILRVGPMLNGKSFNAYQFVPGSVEATKGAVRLLAFLGMDEIKVHRRMPRDWYYAALDEAKTLKIDVIGHIPLEVTPEEASKAGQYMIEHTETLFEGTFAVNLTEAQMPGAIRAWLATEKPDSLFATFQKNGTWMDPTLSGYLEVADMFDPGTPPDPRYRYVANSYRKQFLEQQKQHPMSAEQVKDLRDHFNLLLDVTARMHRHHVRMVAGTDAAGPRLVGFSLHRELATLVRVGLSNLEALQTATLNPAIAFHRESDLGAAEVGKFADLVLLDANPLESIENTQRIYSVIARGRLFRRRELDSLMALAERLARTH